MKHQPKDFQRLIAECNGFLSETQLKAHFELYQGYVKKLNEIEEGLRQADRETANYSFGEYSELRRREPVAYNGTVLHELYFENLGREAAQPRRRSARRSRSRAARGTSAVADVKGDGGVRARLGAGRARRQLRGVRSHLVQSEHHVGLLPNQTILLAIDCWEHAYFADYQTKKAAYVDGLLKHVNWPAVAARWARLRGAGAGDRACLSATRPGSPGSTCSGRTRWRTRAALPPPSRRDGTHRSTGGAPPPPGWPRSSAWPPAWRSSASGACADQQEDLWDSCLWAMTASRAGWRRS